MLKAIFLDLDETLCNTTGANEKALVRFKQRLLEVQPSLDVDTFSKRYLAGVYKLINDEMPDAVNALPDELMFRSYVIKTLFSEQGVDIDIDTAKELQCYFDEQRISNFCFFPKVEETLAELRKRYTLVVITNGPIFSQHPKIAAVDLPLHVDHIIVGGEEPQEKPFVSIFEKAMRLANCVASEAIHIGDSLSADIAGAKASGVGSVWVNSFKDEDIQKAKEMQVDYILDNPSDLAQAIAFFE